MVFGGLLRPRPLFLICNTDACFQFSPSLLRTIRRLIENEGAVKIRSIVQATSLPQPVLDLTHRYVELCVAFRSSGTDG